MFSTSILLSLVACAAALPHPQPPVLGRSLPETSATSVWERDTTHEHRLRALRARYAPESASAHQRRDLGESAAGITAYGADTLYTTRVSVGTPPQSIEVHLDTGAGNTYLYTGCTELACAGGPQYNPAGSSSAALAGPGYYSEHTRIEFGDEFVEGDWREEDMGLGGGVVKSQKFLGARRVDDAYKGTNVSGMVGLGWAPLATPGITPLWIGLAEQWNDKRFGMRLARSNVPPGSAPVATPGGSITFGGVDESAFKGDVHYIPLLSADYWRVRLDSIVANGVSLSQAGQRSAAVDTGTTLLAGPKVVVERMYARIDGARADNSTGREGSYRVPCDAKLDLALEFGGRRFPVSPQDMVVHDGAADGSCRGGLDAVDGTDVSWILGATFLKNVYAVFQYQPPAVGFADLA